AEDEVAIDTPLASVHLTNRGARVVSWKLKKYLDDAGHPLELVSNAGRALDHLPLQFLLEDPGATKRLKEGRIASRERWTAQRAPDREARPDEPQTGRAVAGRGTGELGRSRGQIFRRAVRAGGGRSWTRALRAPATGRRRAGGAAPVDGAGPAGSLPSPPVRRPEGLRHPEGARDRPGASAQFRLLRIHRAAAVLLDEVPAALHRQLRLGDCHPDGGEPDPVLPEHVPRADPHAHDAGEDEARPAEGEGSARTLPQAREEGGGQGEPGSAAEAAPGDERGDDGALQGGGHQPAGLDVGLSADPP